MVHEELIETLPLYAAGVLDRAQRQEIDTHLLTGCPACHADLKELQAVAALLPYALSPMAPPRPLKAAVLKSCPSAHSAPEVQQRPNRPSLEPGEWMKHLFPPTPRFPTWAPPALAIFASLFAGSFLYMGYAAYVRTNTDTSIITGLHTEMQQARQQIDTLEEQIGQRDRAIADLTAAVTTRDGMINQLRETVILREAELDDLRYQLTQLDKDASALRRSRAQLADVVGLLRSPTTRVVTMQGAESARGAGGLLLYDPPTGRAFFYAYNLAPPPIGRAYRLWAIDRKPISAGLLYVDSGQKARLAIKSLSAVADISRFVVTLEEEGEAPQPTGPIYLTGTP